MNINAIKNSKFGKMLRRIVGEETGAVMMEYVIIAVMIAAAVAVGAWYFGRSVNNEFRVASHATVGGHDTAKTTQDNAQGAVAGQDESARQAQKDMIELKDNSSADL